MSGQVFCRVALVLALLAVPCIGQTRSATCPTDAQALTRTTDSLCKCTCAAGFTARNKVPMLELDRKLRNGSQACGKDIESSAAFKALPFSIAYNLLGSCCMIHNQAVSTCGVGFTLARNSLLTCLNRCNGNLAVYPGVTAANMEAVRANCNSVANAFRAQRLGTSLGQSCRFHLSVQRQACECFKPSTPSGR
mmetsp:Transcript_6285/g.13827  ORF Transcript_6285/g.13827 Transcript_6285/m.13827 type:complete len:193 (+) Transcript_6285:209-787(+)|eukprot:CAMPEP_0202890608 /NCGR_PEP_ID=MMETSP1392-20130828/956_1 /ASSEMBLY_ACC=CAM_ASM_000868 /TAXON_ID=225041 /ORGANISM="Chlamydomonas chlamydogama, Strain SAG 11-48b" /LENGTH=192 /DNA_ID=CAMNT_0049574209 /DNA_START=206 /DNA_END=784 /DNA_ORIENTATION=-